MEDQLIKAINLRKAIWDPNDESRRNSRSLTKLWIDISDETGIDIKVAKSRWKNLRAYYVKEFYKLRKRKSAKRISTWPFYNQLRFLESALFPYIHRQNKINNPEVNKLDHTQDLLEERKELIQIPEQEPDLEPEIEIEPEPKLEQYDNVVEASDTEQSSDGSSKNFSRDGQPKEKLRRTEFVSCIKKNQAALIEIEKRKLELLERENAIPEDDDLLFFRSLIPYLKRLPDIRRLRLRSKINDLILQEIEELSY